MKQLLPIWNFPEKDVVKILSDFEEKWDIWFCKEPESSYKKNKYGIFILAKDTPVEWLCYDDKKESKKFFKNANNNTYEISDILITGRSIMGYQIHNYTNSRYGCKINDTYGNTEEEYLLLTIEQLIITLKEKIINKTNK